MLKIPLFAAAYFFIEQQFFQLLSVWATGLAILAGAVLSFINFLLMKSNGQIDFAITLQRLAIVLSPAIYELQKKRDIFSAMVSHGLVDAVRFALFGIGM